MTVEAELGEVVAERRLEARTPDGRIREVVLRVGRPHPGAEEGIDWTCPGHVEGLGPAGVVPVHGVDSLQALLLCLFRLRTSVESAAREQGAVLTWLGGEDLALADATAGSTG
ncbi:hypothetical protein ABT143_14575 [Streptomyces sp. NPDC002033]|uniref:DUF6968 family protein n=1 Tax=unclassified Streptomyces TaxID=2593676 RepID=UPI00332E9ADC